MKEKFTLAFTMIPSLAHPDSSPNGGIVLGQMHLKNRFQ